MTYWSIVRLMGLRGKKLIRNWCLVFLADPAESERGQPSAFIALTRAEKSFTMVLRMQSVTSGQRNPMTPVSCITSALGVASLNLKPRTTSIDQVSPFSCLLTRTDLIR